MALAEEEAEVVGPEEVEVVGHQHQESCRHGSHLRSNYLHRIQKTALSM